MCLAALIFAGSLSCSKAPEPGVGQADAAQRYEPYRIYQLAGRSFGHRLRGDWEAPDTVLLAYTESWPDTLADLISATRGQASVDLLVDPPRTTEVELQDWRARWNLDGDHLRVRRIRHDTPWVRDYGPLEVLQPNGDANWLDPEYGAARRADDLVPAALASELRVPWERLPFPVGGGAIISNGRGLCASTLEYCVENCIDFDDPPLMDALLGKLGCQVLALLPALRDDPTRHVDMFAQFLAPGVVAVADLEPFDSEEDASRMDDAARGLRAAAARLGLGLRVVRVPVPYSGDRQYRTYVNGLRLRTMFVAPSYGDVPDEIESTAYRLLSDAMPGTSVVAVPADSLIQLFGSLHCITSGVTAPTDARGATSSGTGDRSTSTSTVGDEPAPTKDQTEGWKDGRHSD